MQLHMGNLVYAKSLDPPRPQIEWSVVGHDNIIEDCYHIFTLLRTYH